MKEAGRGGVLSDDLVLWDGSLVRWEAGGGGHTD